MKTATLLRLAGALAPLTLTLHLTATESAPVNFTEHIAPVLYANCAQCHHPGTAAPFSLLTYADAKKRAKTIAEVTAKGVMPPWLPDREGNPHFLGESHLSDAQLALLQRWVAAGAPEGPAEQLPPAPRFKDGWQLGTPDLVVTMPTVYETPATGRDEYRDFVIPLNVPEDKFVRAVEYRPSSPAIHHATFNLDNTHRARALEGKDGRPGYDHFANLGMGKGTGNLGGWVVGRTPRELPLNLAYTLKRDSDLVLSLHIHPTGKVEREQSTVAIYFADKAPDTFMLPLALPPKFGMWSGLDIPAGAKDFTLRDSFTLPADMLMWMSRIHMHYLGKSVKALAILPDGRREPLLTISKFDFDWQDHYIFEKPLLLPKGTVIHAELTWDNSAENPDNPHTPPQRVGFGLGSDEEMGQFGALFVPVNKRDAPIFLQATQKHLAETMTAARAKGIRPYMPPGVAATGAAAGAGGLWERLKKADGNGDGKISRDEAPAQLKENFDRIDSNHDGFIDKNETEALSLRRGAASANEP